MNTTEILKKIGLSKREINVYLTLLKSGPMLATKLAKKMETSRTNIYDILESLGEKGLVVKGSKSYSKYYIPEPPNKIEEKLARKVNEIEILKDEFKKALPGLESLSPVLELTPKIKIFEGKEAIQGLMEETIKTPLKETLLATGGEGIEKILGEVFLKGYIQKRVERKIRNRVIKKKRFWQMSLEKDKEELRESKYLPSQIKFDSTLIIYGDNVVIISSEKEDFGFSIQSKELSHLFKVFFEMLWGASNKS